MNCKKCSAPCIRKGYNGKIQKYRCKDCGLYQQAVYTYSCTSKETDIEIIKLNNVGLGTTCIAEVVRKPKSVVNYRLRKIGSMITIPELLENDQVYEADEMATFVGNKDNEVYVFYAINRHTRKPTGLVVGKRTKENAAGIIAPINNCNPKKIYTDGLNIYPPLIEKTKHGTFKTQINRIERKNLTVRTRIKRLNRSTLSFSKSIVMLEICIKIYFWGYLLL